MVVGKLKIFYEGGYYEILGIGRMLQRQKVKKAFVKKSNRSIT